MRSFLLLSFSLAALSGFSQKQQYDLVNYVAPAGWKKEAKPTMMTYTMTDNKRKAWGQVFVVKSTASKGSIDADFESEWQELAVKNYHPGAPDTTAVEETEGWKVKSGMGKFVFDRKDAMVLVYTASGYGRCASVVAITNDSAYSHTIVSFLESLEMVKPATTTPSSPQTVTGAVRNTGFTFNTTNFDDGWTSVVKEDWVEVTKGSLKVLLHYPREEDKNYYTQYEERLKVFWNLLVTPRYSNLRQYQSPGYNYSSEPGYYGAGLLNDNATKKDVWVVLFSKGKSGWIEVIAPDKASFVQSFGIDNPDRYFSDWDALLRLAGMNRFAVGENDLIGKWSNQFSSSSAYYSIYTGIYAGSSTYASSQSFVFEKTKTYQWNLAVGKSGVNTGMQVDKASANGNWKLVTNWQIWFSDIERKPKTYNAYFSCIKGGRILWLQDVEYGSYTAYGKISN